MKCVVVHRVASCASETEGIETAKPAERPYGLSRDGRHKWTPAALAHWFANRLKRCKAGRANWDPARSRERLAADPARSREEHCGECIERAS